MKAPDDLKTQQELRDAKRDYKVERLRQAFLIEGACPSYHRQQKAKLQQNWGVLYDAIEDLLKE